MLSTYNNFHIINHLHITSKAHSNGTCTVSEYFLISSTLLQEPQCSKFVVKVLVTNTVQIGCLGYRFCLWHTFFFFLLSLHIAHVNRAGYFAVIVDGLIKKCPVPCIYLDNAAVFRSYQPTSNYISYLYHTNKYWWYTIPV